MGVSEIGRFSEAVEEFFELEGLPASLGAVCDSNSSNDFLRFLPMGGGLLASGSWCDVPKRGTRS